MDFAHTSEALETPSLVMEYFLVPWDSEIFGRPVGQIDRLVVKDSVGANQDFGKFSDWCRAQGITLCSCRIPHDRLTESLFLQQHEFRFIELNYRPYLNGLQNRRFTSTGIEVLEACAADEDELAAMAATVFEHGRFHQDPQLGPALGNRRYERWMRNSFNHPRQTTYKCVREDQTVGFFVVEYPTDTACHWSLIGLAPGLAGKGWGTRVWQAMLEFHQTQGLDRVETSISSHNTAVFNLYVKLGFRFPLPSATFHWHERIDERSAQ
jgi:ribosomal protein S18 acetylase RimI-like enzyme